MVSEALHVDEALIQKLPLPLAKLARRASNAKTPLERHQAAFYLWEASLKLLGSVAVVAYAEPGDHDPKLAVMLEGLARPSLGQWWEFVLRLVPVLADAGDEGFSRVRDLLLGRARDDMPRATGLDVALLEVQSGKSPAHVTVRLTELFNRLVHYRNKEIGHGAAGQRSERFYDKMAMALVPGVAQVLERLDVLAGRRLVYVGDVRWQTSGAWLVERYDLIGESARRIESLEVPLAEATALPRPERVYLQSDGGRGPDAVPRFLSLHPLIHYEHESDKVFFLNARRERKQVEYLCYHDGDTLNRYPGSDQRELLARVLRMEVDEATAEEWAVRSLAQEPALPAGAAAPEPAERTIGEYQLLSRLGQGGMGVVYRAWQPSLGRQVALKCMLPTGDSKTEERFAREIRALGRVEHPHIVKVFTSGSEGDRWFFVMELVEGTDLGRICQHLAGRDASQVDGLTWREALTSACAVSRSEETPLSSKQADERPVDARDDQKDSGEGEPPIAPEPVSAPDGPGYIDKVVAIIQQVAEASHALHEAGVVHRDIKPGNIMITHDGKVPVLMDLGLAQLADEADGRLTRTRQFVGTLRYASPEQILAAANVDRRSDVYSLGATLWELLTLRPLFDATDELPTPELMQRIQTTDPVKPRKHNPHVPRDLEAIILKCLERNPARRYSTAADLALDLGRYLRGEPVQAQPPTIRYVATKYILKHKIRIGVVAALFLLLLGVAAFSFMEIRTAHKEAVAALVLEQKARGEVERLAGRQEQANRLLAEQQQELRHRLAENYVQSGINDCVAGQPGLGLSSVLAAYEAAPTQDPLRYSARVLMAGWEPSLASRVLHDDAIEAVGFHPSLPMVMTASRDRTIRFWDVKTGMPQGRVMRTSGMVWAAVFSPDGKLLATGDDERGALLWDVETQLPLGSPIVHPKPVRALCFSPDGKLLATGCKDGLARLWNVSTRARVGEPLAHEKEVFALAFSPDGGTLATGSEDTFLRFWDVQSGRLAGAPIAHDDGVWTVAYSPNGRLLFTGSWSGVGRLFEVASRRLIHDLIRHKEGILCAVFSPDGKRLLVGSRDNSAQFWDVEKGIRIGQTYEHLRSIRAVAIGPDGKSFMTGSRDCVARVFREFKLKPAGVSLVHPGAVLGLAVLASGNHLATACRDGTARLWDLTTGQPLGTQMHHEGPVSAVALSFDGRSLVTGSEDKTLRQWNAESGAPLADLIPCRDVVTSLSLFPDEPWALVGGLDGAAQCLDLKTGRPQKEPIRHGGAVRAVVVVPGGRFLATAGMDRTVRLLDRATWLPWGKPMTHNDGVLALAVDPAGRILVSGSADNTARIWDLSTQSLLRQLDGHDRDVVAVAISPDGRTILTGSEDQTTRLWDTYTGKLICEPLAHDSAVRALAFLPDAAHYLVARDSGTVDVWPTPEPLPDEPDRIAAWIDARTAWTRREGGVHRRLTVDEWSASWEKLARLGGPFPLWDGR
jgi:eukaryotic-like serine/threonine-protein kinase